MYLTLFYVSIMLVFFICRYDLDYRLFAFIARLWFAKDTDEELPTIQDIYPVRDESFYEKYDERMNTLQQEIDNYNNAPSDAVELMGVKNIPHELVEMTAELEPAVEEEDEQGPQEIAR